MYPILGLLFFSGFTSLVYQVIWMRELALLFGSTSQATAGTLAVFFSGLAIGGVIWSRRAPLAQQPLAEYGFLEIGIGLSGILYFGLLPLYANLYSPLYDALGGMPSMLSAAKLLLAAIVLLPPAILMGGTLPLICQQVVNRENTLGKVGSLVYGVNTLGAACGALAAGFWLPAWLGFNATYLLAVFVSLAIGVLAWLVSRRCATKAEGAIPNSTQTESTASEKKVVTPSMAVSRVTLVTITFFSGALVLALEVLWTRMFQQVLQNSVYTFSIILVVFLLALAVGAFLAGRLANVNVKAEKIITVLLGASALASLATPFLFYQITEGMRYLGSGEAWFSYLFSIFTAAAAVLFLPGVVVGTVFPYLFRVAERSGEPGRVMGRLSAANTTGAIVGSLIAGFVLLGALGLWNSIILVALMYVILTVYVACARRITLVVPAVVMLAFVVINPTLFPGVRLNADTENLLGHWEGKDGYVAVIEQDGSKRIKINNFYALGSTGAAEQEQNQTLIPLLSHRSPEKLFYLGMGTGITAGAGLLLPSQQVTVAELVPEVITAASHFFNDEAMGLFTDPRAAILAHDGRNELLGRDKQYDAILADLFIPWRAGVANLYSRDHYRVAKSRLRAGGVYVQWIPLYQMTEAEFWTVTRTFLDVFPQVQAWRGDFYSDHPALALVGSVEAEPMQLANIVRNGRYLSGNTQSNPVTFLAVNLPFYAGNLGESREMVPDGPIHTDDFPIIEYQAPISHRNARAGRSEWFTGGTLIDFFDQLQAATPPEEDPYLSELDPRAQRFVSAGNSYHKSAILRSLGNENEAEHYLQKFLEQLPVQVAFDTDSKGAAQVEE